MSSHPIQLIPQLLQSIERGQSQQLVSVSGPVYQTLQPNQGAFSSGGPNASQTFQVANSTINHTTYNITYIDNSNLGARAITNEDHGAHPQDSQSTVISYASQSTTEASRFIVSNSVQNVQPSDLSADRADFNAKLAAVKQSTIDVRKSAAELRESTVNLDEVTVKSAEVTAELGEAGVIADFIVEGSMSAFKLSRSTIEFGQLNVSYGESIVRDSDSMTTVGESNSLVVFDASTLKLAIARYRESCTSHMESFAYFFDISNLKSHSSELKKVCEDLEFNGSVGLGVLKSIAVEFGESVNTVDKSLTALGESITALADLLAAFK